MKNTLSSISYKQEILWTLKEIDNVLSKISFTNEEKLIDALSYELLALKSRYGYMIEQVKDEVNE